MSQAKAKPLLLPQRRQLILPQGFRDRRKLPDVRAPWIWVPKRVIEPVRGSVVIDVTGTEHGFATAATSQTYGPGGAGGITIGSGLTNGAAVFGVVACQSLGGLAGTTFSATWNGVACTQIIRRDQTNSVGSYALFGIINPASGNKNFVVTTTNSCTMTIQGTSFSGVNQTGGATSFANSVVNDNPNSTSTTLTVTTANGDYTYCMSGNGGTSTTGLTPGNIYSDAATLINAGITALGAQNAETTTSRVYTSTNSPSDFSCMLGVDIVAAAGAADTLAGGQSVFHMRRKSVGWTPLMDPRARILRRQRRS